MRPLHPKGKLAIIILVIGISISLNFLTFLQAIPETQKIDSGCCAPAGTILAKDFSAFYFAAWNLIHDTSRIYLSGSSANATFLGIGPHPESYKYLPSFLILITPFLFLNYYEALVAFDALQFVLLFLIAFLVFKILGGKNIAVVGIVSVLALLLPFSTNPGWGISEAYFWQWAEGQSKVLELVLVLLALYFGRMKRPAVSGIFFGLTFFDPRFTLVSIPLFMAVNRGKVVRAAEVTALTIALTNIPILVYPGVTASFFEMLTAGALTTPIYYYAYIPLLTIIALSIANWREIWEVFRLKPREGPPINSSVFSK